MHMWFSHSTPSFLLSPLPLPLSHTLCFVDCNKAGPNLLRAIYFNVDTFRVEQPLVPSLDLPKALHLVSDPDDCISYESAMNEVWLCGEGMGGVM